jgi:hypothetical protein
MSHPFPQSIPSLPQFLQSIPWIVHFNNPSNNQFHHFHNPCNQFHELSTSTILAINLMSCPPSSTTLAIEISWVAHFLWQPLQLHFIFFQQLSYGLIELPNSTSILFNVKNYHYGGHPLVPTNLCICSSRFNRWCWRSSTNLIMNTQIKCHQMQSTFIS